MALSRSIQKGQVPTCCELCEIDTQINWKCLNCNVFMCTKCKDIHIKIKSIDKHKILDINEVEQHSTELDFCNLNCISHEEQTCFMFCKSCEQIVCPPCIAEVHEGHWLVQISEGYKIKIKKLKEIQEQIKSQIEELTNGESKIILLTKEESFKYTETRNRIQAQNAALKKEVDEYTEKLIKELDQKWETLQNSLVEEERKVIAMKTNKEDQHAKIDHIINSGDADKVFKEGIQKGNFIEALEPIKLKFSTMPKFFPGKITEYDFGSLQDEHKDLVLNVCQQFTTDIDRVFHLSACHDNSLWISDGKVIKRVKPEGSNLKVMSNFKMKIWDTALTPSNDLLLVTEGASRLTQISGSSGQITDSVYSADPLVITEIHVTSDNKVIVAAHDDDVDDDYADNNREVLIMMNKEGKHEKTYEHDRNKQPIFTYVKNITSTTNGTIFVLDKLSDDRGRVVALGQDGDILNTYTGHPSIYSDDQPFLPLCTVTTPLDNIIITTKMIYILHILNSVGSLITYYNTENIGILRPFSLSFSRSGQLYIGCTTRKYSTDKGKLYKVDISLI